MQVNHNINIKVPEQRANKAALTHADMHTIWVDTDSNPVLIASSGNDKQPFTLAKTGWIVGCTWPLTRAPDDTTLTFAQDPVRGTSARGAGGKSAQERFVEEMGKSAAAKRQPSHDTHVNPAADMPVEDFLKSFSHAGMTDLLDMRDLVETGAKEKTYDKYRPLQKLRLRKFEEQGIIKLVMADDASKVSLTPFGEIVVKAALTGGSRHTREDIKLPKTTEKRSQTARRKAAELGV